MREPHELIAIRSGVNADEIRAELRSTRRKAARFHANAPSASQERSASAKTDASPDLRLSGYSAVFDSDSERLFGFLREQVKRGAFKNVLRRKPDVRLLINHEGAPFARTTNDTLTLTQTPRGLLMEADLDPRRSDARDLYYGVERGDYDQQSFAFTIAADEWRYCECVEAEDYAGCDCEWQRDITEIGDLYEVSVVTFPAYPDTSVTVARESEPSSERGARASDEEPREVAADDSDASTTPSVSDPTEQRKRRARLARVRGLHDVRRDSRGPR